MRRHSCRTLSMRLEIRLLRVCLVIVSMMGMVAENGYECNRFAIDILVR
jgi:hypothetical protein